MSLWEVTVEVPMIVRGDTREEAEAIAMNEIEMALPGDILREGIKVGGARGLTKRSEVSVDELDAYPFGKDEGKTIGEFLPEAT